MSSLLSWHSELLYGQRAQLLRGAQQHCFVLRTSSDKLPWFISAHIPSFQSLWVAQPQQFAFDCIPMHHDIFSILGLYLMPVASYFPVVTTRNVSSCCQVSPLRITAKPPCSGGAQKESSWESWGEAVGEVCRGTEVG